MGNGAMGGGGSSTGGGAGTAGSGGSSTGGGAGTAGSGGSAGEAPSTDATIAPDPSWTCGAADGIVPPTKGELVFTATIELGDTHDFGTTPYGHRRLLDVTGGTLEGDLVEATFLEGGLELELELENGSLELEQINLLEASDGTLIYLRTCGVAPAGSSEVRIVPDFEVANDSSLAWLNTGKFVGTRTLDEAAGTLQLSVYDIADVAVAEPKVQITDPVDVPNQPWECSTQTGTKGASVFSETVTLGASLSIGASKRGTRNVIPITGGTVTGQVEGSVLPGGADYQLIGGSTKLDARYTLSGADGELILVRNCGAFGALVPLFEARSEGPYAFLNQNQYLSSDPGSAAGGVSITFYERN
jgi:hypothetical protein